MFVLFRYLEKPKLPRGTVAESTNSDLEGLQPVRLLAGKNLTQTRTGKYFSEDRFHQAIITSKLNKK